MTRWLSGSAILGSLALPAVAFGASIDVLAVLTLMGPLVVVPLGFALLLRDAPPSRPLAVAMALQPFAAALAAASWAFPTGHAAAAILAIPWFGVTALAAIAGLDRLTRALRDGFPAFLVTAGLLFLPVGGSMLVLARWGMEVLGFPLVIVLLTAVHFHYTGFAVPLLAGLAGRSADTPGLRRNLLAAGLPIVFAPPFIALGFMVSPALQFAGIAALVLGVWALGALQFRILPRLRRARPRDLLTLSTVAAAAGMALAGIYGAGEFLERPWIDIPSMGWSHGLLNGVGFVLGGLLAWTLEPAPPRGPDIRRPRRG